MSSKTGTFTVRLTDEDKRRIKHLEDVLKVKPTDVVREALKALEKREQWAEMRRQAEAIAADPREQALARQIMDDWEDASAW